MRIIEQSYEILTSSTSLLEMSKIMERFGRNCWKSHDKTTDCSFDPFIRNIRGKHHDSVTEHALISVEIVTSRAVTHQLVRHRLASYSQESQRYVNYHKEKFGNEVAFIRPVEYTSWTEAQQKAWVSACTNSEVDYFAMLNAGLKAEDARDALNNACATTIGVSMNPRQWNHVFHERCSNGAQKPIRQLFTAIRADMQKLQPHLFEPIS